MKHSKKKKKDSSSFEKMRTFRKIFSAFFSVVIIFDVFTHVIVKSQDVSSSLREATERLAYSKVIEEQLEHFVGVRKVVKESEETFVSVDEFVMVIEKGRFLTKEQKINLAIELKSVEENAFTLQQAFDEYYDDATIQYHPMANSSVSNYFYETSLLRLAMERFSRRAENHLLFSIPNANGRDIIVEDYYDVIWQLDHLKEIEKNIKVLESLNR